MTVSSSPRTVTLLLFLAFSLRVIAVAFHPIGDSLFSDMEVYRRIADSIVAGTWNDGHYFQGIGFPLIVALCKRLAANWTSVLAAYHVALSTATVWLVWKTARRAFGDVVAILSLALSAVHVPWIVLTTVALAETTFAFLLAGLAWASLEIVERPSARWAATWGLLFVLAFWVKGTHAFLGPFFLLALLAWHRWSRTAFVTVALPISAVVAAGLILHGVLSYETTGTFRLGAASGGLNLVEGKCPSKRNFDTTGMSTLSPIYGQLGMTSSKMWDRPFTDSGFFMKEGLKCVVRDPIVLLQSIEGIPFLFVGNYMWPSVDFSMAPFLRLYELFDGPFLMSGVVLWLVSRWPWRREQGPELIVWAVPFVALCLCVYVFKSEIRFRVPFDVWLIPMAVGGWTAALPRMRDRLDPSL